MDAEGPFVAMLSAAVGVGRKQPLVIARGTAVHTASEAGVHTAMSTASSMLAVVVRLPLVRAVLHPNHPDRVMWYLCK